MNPVTMHEVGSRKAGNLWNIKIKIYFMTIYENLLSEKQDDSEKAYDNLHPTKKKWVVVALKSTNYIFFIKEPRATFKRQKCSKIRLW